MISAAFFWPMPWMYWSAIKTRLLVGIFTPAIRATDFSPVADRFDRQFFANSGRCPQTRTRRPPLRFPRGPASSENYPTWIRGLLKDSTWFRQPPLCFSSLFRDLFGGFPGLRSSSRLGTDRQLAGWLFQPPGGRFAGLSGALGCLFGGSRVLAGGFGGFPGGRPGALFGTLFGTLSDSPGRGRLF